MPLTYLIRPLHAMVWVLIVSPLVNDHSTDRQHVIFVIVRAFQITYTCIIIACCLLITEVTCMPLQGRYTTVIHLF
jgi:hypothetical protein